MRTSRALLWKLLMVFAMLAAGCTGGSVHAAVAVPAAASPAENAYQHLVEVMDRYNAQYFEVYEDIGSAGNHFVHRAMMGTSAGIDDGWTGTVHSGATAVKNTFSGYGSEWGGWYFQNGVLQGDAVTPTSNWGDYPNAGIDLTGATELTFWARGELGGERIEPFAFGVGWQGATQIAPYPDSSPKVTLCGKLSGQCYITLSATWTQYTIKLTGLDLHYVLGGFGWVTNAPNNGNRSITFYLDDIRYNKARPNDLHLLVSYRTLPSTLEFDTQQRNVTYVYDNAVALNAFIARGDAARAKLLADAFVYAIDHDRYYADGRLRDGYQGGDLALPPGWEPYGKVATTRMCGWWIAPDHWEENAECVGSHTGNLAWAMIALMNYYEQYGGSAYLDTAVRLGEWIQANTYDTRGPGGYTGGYAGWEPNQVKETWKSTEHNLDLWVAFSRLAGLTGNSTWQARAQHARDLVEAMWSPGSPGHYWTGTLEDGVTPNRQTVPLDPQSWGLLALGANDRTRQAVQYAEDHHRTTWGGFEGFDFNDDRDQPWSEGTAQMVSAYRALGDDASVEHFLAELREVQASAANGNGKGIVAAPADGLTTGFGWYYYNRLHVGATAWFVAAELAYDNYYGLWTASVPLAAGWTLVTLPLRPQSSLTAQAALDAITAQGGSCSEMDRWLNGGWDSHTAGLPVNDFELSLGQGFFLKCSAPHTWRVAGRALTTAVALSLQPSWNLTGVPYPAEAYSAQGLLDAIAAQGGACSEVDRWLNGGWDAHVSGLSFNDFAIASDQGYFVKCSKNSTFTGG